MLSTTKFKSVSFFSIYPACVLHVGEMIATIQWCSLEIQILVSSRVPPFRLAASVQVLVMRKRGESSWSGPWHLVCTLEVFHVHSYQDQFIHPGWAECVFCIFSLGLYFVYSFEFLWFVCVSPSFYVSLGSWVISLTVFGVSITNLNEPRALATSTTAWVRSQLHPFWAVVNKSNAG